MPTGASDLSLAASVLYLLVAGSVVAAAFCARQNRQRDWHVRNWLLLGMLFIALAAARMFEIEDLARGELRDWLLARGDYSDRRNIQGPIAAALVFVVTICGLWWFNRSAKTVRGRRNIAVKTASASGIAMILLVCARLLSLHLIDALLYGPVKLNWFADIGLSLFVIAAAMYYVRIVRSAG